MRVKKRKSVEVWGGSWLLVYELRSHPEGPGHTDVSWCFLSVACRWSCFLSPAEGGASRWELMQVLMFGVCNLLVPVWSCVYVKHWIVEMIISPHMSIHQRFAQRNPGFCVYCMTRSSRLSQLICFLWWYVLHALQQQLLAFVTLHWFLRWCFYFHGLPQSSWNHTPSSRASKSTHMFFWLKVKALENFVFHLTSIIMSSS